MSTATLPRPSTFAVSTGFGVTPKMYKKDNGMLVLEGVAVFRSGTFRDSMGIQNTWEKLHIDQMVGNFNHLKSSGVFDDVPVRDGHPGWLIHGLPGNGKTIGWHTSLRTEELEAPHDGMKYHYLLGDFEITDPEARANIENGTWRNRSAEIGTYVSNAEAEYWPVYMGVAYVDIPAVEGLKFDSPNGGGAKFYMLLDGVSLNKENSVGTTDPTQAAPATNPTLPFGDGAAPAHVFSVNGKQVSDYSAVQAHINALEKFQAESMEQNRRDFVASLAKDGKILATQLDGQTEFALGLTPEQYTKWCGTWGQAAKAPVLGNHADGVSDPDNKAQSGQDAQEEQYSIWRDTVLAHKMAGTPVDKIKASASYRSLIAAGQTVDL